MTLPHWNRRASGAWQEMADRCDVLEGLDLESICGPLYIKGYLMTPA